jgi:uncharacterized membrane-anchored protein YitT (DUF2179 family)
MGSVEASPATERHSFFDDVQAIVTASAFVSLGLGFLARAKLLAGGTAGLALIVARLTPLSFGQAFLALNVPFFWLGVRQMGWRFTVKTFAAIGLVSLGSDALPRLVRLEAVQPLYGAVVGGWLVGAGLLMLFRHRACLGGLNILSIWLQERHGVRAGAFQMAVDSAIVVAGFFLVSWRTLLLSIAGAVALNLVLAVNHKPGRYLGT